jgi:hypothetical protein
MGDPLGVSQLGRVDVRRARSKSPLCAKSRPSKPPVADPVDALSPEARSVSGCSFINPPRVVDRRPSDAIDQLMAAKSKEGLQQLFVQHAHNNRPKQGRKCSPE